MKCDFVVVYLHFLTGVQVSRTGQTGLSGYAMSLSPGHWIWPGT